MPLNRKIKKIIIYPPQEFSQSSFILTGVHLYCQQHSIPLKYSLGFTIKKGKLVLNNNKQVKLLNSSYPKLTYVDIVLHNSKKIRVGFDLYDIASHFSLYALEYCDIIFKRSYENRYVAQLNDLKQKKIYSLGLTFRVYYKLKINKKVFLSSLFQNLKYDRYLFKRLISTFQNLTNQVESIKNQRLISQYEHFESGMENSILFQTRAFPSENSLDIQQIHADRYRIIKCLRQEFPHQFKGGFVPSPIANEKYGDALTNVPSQPSAYLKAVKESKIVIYTRGLANSPAWKMAEYLSQGKIIIAERLTTDLPFPLEHGKELLFFDTDDELVKNIRKVMRDKNLQNTLSQNARAYFEKYVHPEKTLERIISTTLRKNA